MKDNQHEQLFTELTPAEAAVVGGGQSIIDTTIDFDFALDSRKFSVTAEDPNVSLGVSELTEFGDDGKFKATLKRVTRGGTTVNVSSKTLSNGASVGFGAQKPGQYLIQFTDKKDDKKVVGRAVIAVF